MSNVINQDEINAILWKACDTFRGTIDPSEYKNYILVMLFVKYISDVWFDHYEQYQQEYGDDPERVERRMSREPFKLPRGSDYYSLYEKRNAINLGEEINMALEKIEEANKEKLDRVFRNIDFNSEAALGRAAQRNERLKNLLDDFNDPRLDLRPSRVNGLDVIGNAYEYLIGRFASDAGKKAGEFYTPPEVSQLLAELLDPQPGERICDPACGSGSLLIRCAKQVGSNDYSIRGQEVNGSTWALCMMNMLLHNMNVTTQQIRWTDTLKEPQLLENDDLMRFNVVVANPPFSLDKWGAEGADERPLQPLLAGRATEEQGGLCLHHTHDRKHVPGGEPERTGGRDRAAWGVVPGEQRGENPAKADRGKFAGCGDRFTGESVLRDGHPGGDIDLQAEPRGRRGAVHRREPGVRAGDQPEPAAGRGFGQDGGDLREAGDG